MHAVDLPLCDFEVFSPAFSMTRQGQTGRKAGAQSHGPLGAAELPKVVDPSWTSTRGDKPEPRVSDPGRRGLETRFSLHAPRPASAGRGSAFLLPVVPSERHHRKHDHQHLDPGLTEAAHGSPCPLLRIRVDAHRPPAFAPPRSEHGSLRRTPRSAGTNWKESAHRTSPGAHTGRGRGVGTLSGLWGRAPSASGGDAYPWDPWGQIPQVRLSTRELRARRRGGSPPGALSGNRVLDPPLG